MRGVIAVFAALVVLAVAGPVGAQEAPSDRARGDRHRDGGEVVVSDGSTAPGGGGDGAQGGDGAGDNGGGGTSDVCTGPGQVLTYAPSDQPGKVWQTCSGGGAGAAQGIGQLVDAGVGGAAGAGPVVVDPVALMQQARARVTVPAPQVSLSPAGDQVAQLATWLWIDPALWTPVSASASAGTVTATVTAAPVRVRWSMGNGDEVVCDGPGRAYGPAAGAPDCAYTYRHSSAGLAGDAFTVTATIEWALSWTAAGAAGGGDLGGVTSDATLPVRVTELQALVQ